MSRYPQDDINFVYCPECGGDISRGGLFSSMGMVFSGTNGRCQDCGKEWHIIWDNFDEWVKEQEDNQ